MKKVDVSSEEGKLLVVAVEEIAKLTNNNSEIGKAYVVSQLKDMAKERFNSSDPRQLTLPLSFPK